MNIGPLGNSEDSMESDDDITSIEIGSWSTENSFGFFHHLIDPEHLKLDINHTHFLLVKGSDAEENQFRHAFEDYVSHLTKFDCKIPFVKIVLGGGKSVLEGVGENLDKQIPCIVIKGTGPATEVLVKARQTYQNKEDLLQLTEIVKSSLSLDNDEVKKVMKILKSCMHKVDYLHIFDPSETDCDDSDKTLSHIIIGSFLGQTLKESDSKDKEQVAKNLLLASNWGHKEMAKLMMEDAALHGTEIEDLSGLGLLIKSLTGKLAFPLLSLFIDVVDPKFLRVYISEPSFVSEILLEKVSVVGKSNMVELEVTNKKLQALIGPFWNTNRKYKNHMANPFNYLFIWAVSTNKMESALSLLKFVRYPIASLLLACNILERQLKMKTTLNDDQVQKNKVIFEDLACSLMIECYSQNEVRTQFLLLQEIPSLGSTSVLQLALQGNCRKLLSCKPAQDLLNQIWYGGITSTTSYLRLLLASLTLSFLAPFIIKYQVDGKEVSKKSDFSPSVSDFSPSSRNAAQRQILDLSTIGIDAGLRHEMPFRDKCIRFLNSPLVKYLYFMYSYILFLIFFTVLIMRESEYFEQIVPSKTEMTVFAFWSDFILHEVGQYVSFESPCFCLKKLPLNLCKGLKDKWNLLDAAIIGLLILCILLRVFSSLAILNPSYAGLLTKMFYCFVYMLFWVRLMHIFTADSLLGPKLEMLASMMNDFFAFLFILTIFGVAYAVVSYTLEASVAHECCGGVEASDFSSYTELFHGLFSTPFWNLFGEIGEFEKFNNQTTSSHFYVFSEMIVLPGVKGIYMLFASVVLLNLLIAMFSYTFTTIQEQAMQIWSFNRHEVIMEYHHRSKLPAPLASISFLVKIVRCFSGCSYESKEPIVFDHTFKVRLESFSPLSLNEETDEWTDEEADEEVDQEVDNEMHTVADKEKNASATKTCCRSCCRSCCTTCVRSETNAEENSFWVDSEWASDYSRTLKRWESDVAFEFWLKRDLIGLAKSNI